MGIARSYDKDKLEDGIEEEKEEGRTVEIELVVKEDGTTDGKEVNTKVI